MAQKRRLFNFHSGINLNKSDIIPIVNYAFSKSFEVTSSNITAIATRGWNPLNYNLLNYIELQDNIGTLNLTEEDLTSEEDLTKNNLNFRCGYAGRAVFDLLQVAQRDREMKKKL